MGLQDGLAGKERSLPPSSGAYIVEGENQYQEVSLTPSHASHVKLKSMTF